jgi:hypothetical protein
MLVNLANDFVRFLEHFRGKGEADEVGGPVIERQIEL